MRRFQKTLLTILVSTNLIAPQAIGQDSRSAEQLIATTEIPEEIVVYGQKNILHLRAELYQAEDVFLEKFNFLNDNKDFEFKCEFITLLENRARKRVCVPKFAKKYEAQVAAAMVRDGSFQTPPHFRAQLRKKQMQLVEEMLTLISENDELRDAQSKLNTAKMVYEEELKVRREK